MNFYVEKIAENLKVFDAAFDKARSPEFEKEMRERYPGPGSIYPCMFGVLESNRHLLSHMLWLVEQFKPHLEYMERLTKVGEALHIDEDTLPDLELMVAEGGYKGRYRSELSDLQEKITEAAGEVRSDKVEREKDNAITIMEAAGFKEDEDAGEWHLRPEKSEKVLIEWQRKESAYFFMLERDGAEVLRGKSGEFGKLLEAVGIAQNVEQPKC